MAGGSAVSCGGGLSQRGEVLVSCGNFESLGGYIHSIGAHGHVNIRH